MADEESNSSKSHRPKQSGPKAGKKKSRSEDKDKSNNSKHNAKAFTFNSVVKAAKQFRRSKDIETKKHHVPVVDRTPLEPPPIIVAVVGPPKVGKTTLINSLLKNFTRQNLSNIQGPVTLVSGKKRRITLIECGNDINSMIDIAKIADLILLLIDASFGFEMEVFEFLNICQVHGFPKIMGVLTHLDMLKNNKSLKKTKKKLKDRFWTEVYQGAKLFYLSGLVHGCYPKVEVHNLGRFISVMKFRPLTWQTSHPYILADRMEDLTDPENVRQNPKCDRKVSLYGYVRGAYLKYNTKVHLLGCGDYKLDDLSLLRDPCPLPDKEKKRTLNEKERLVYAPMSGVGGIVYDKDAVYIDLGGSHSGKVDIEQETKDAEDSSKPDNELMSSLIDTKHTLDSKIASSHMTLFKDGISVSTQEFTENNNLPAQQTLQSKDGRVRRKALFDGSEDESDDDFDDDVPFADKDDEDISGSDDDGADDGDDDEFPLDDDFDDDDVLSDNLSNNNDDKTKDGITLLQNPGLKRKAMENAMDSNGSDNEFYEESLNQSNTSKKNKKEEKSSERVDSELKRKKKKREKTNNSSDEDSDNELEMKTKRKKSSKINEKLSSDLSKRSKNSIPSTKPQKQDSSESETDSEVDFESNDESDNVCDDKMDNGDVNNSENDSESIIEEEIQSDSDNGRLKWKDNILQKASEAFYKHQQSTPNLRKLVYGKANETASKNHIDSDEDDQTIGGFFKVKSKKREIDDVMQMRDCSLEDEGSLDLQEVIANIQDCFVTGKWNEDEDAEQLLKQDDQLSDNEIYGDFEDLETGETHSANDAGEKEDEDETQQSEEDEQKEKQDKMSRIEKKKKLKAAFNSQYDEGDEASFYEELKEQMSEQAQLNQREFEDMDDETRVQYEGFRPGMYVRVELKNMPCEFVTNFDARYPIILGGVLSNEDTLGYIQVRIKKHRWFKRILKTRDPLILSIGWRRFQSLVMYSMQDHNGRHRLLKYTPEHLHCTASFYGPLAPPNTGVLAVQSIAGSTSDFRISATGTVLALDKSIELVKKLKLTGTPTKVFKNTAFIKGMFNSSLEVAKFEGASIKSVSGIRGQIKRAIKAPEGAFRATFEDKLLLSDIVFVRTWYPVTIPKFYNPVTSLLLPNEAKVAWEGMKTVGQLRKVAGIKAPVNQDSIYKPIKRQKRHFNPLVVPGKLQKNLPFKSKPKDMKKRRKPTMEAKRAVVMEPHEKKVYTLMQQLYTANKEKVRKRKEKMDEKRKIHKAELAKIDAKRQQKRKDERKKVFKMMARAEKKKN